jgi:1-acyl-sn-glycerol-3-phosphate acyltransferase
MDILVGLVLFFPSFVSKKSIKKYPFIGMIATAIDCVFTDRAGTKEEKIAVAKQIVDR